MDNKRRNQFPGGRLDQKSVLTMAGYACKSLDFWGIVKICCILVLSQEQIATFCPKERVVTRENFEIIWKIWKFE